MSAERSGPGRPPVDGSCVGDVQIRCTATIGLAIARDEIPASVLGFLAHVVRRRYVGRRLNETAAYRQIVDGDTGVGIGGIERSDC